MVNHARAEVPNGTRVPVSPHPHPWFRKRRGSITPEGCGSTVLVIQPLLLLKPGLLCFLGLQLLGSRCPSASVKIIDFIKPLYWRTLLLFCWIRWEICINIVSESLGMSE